jgi:carbamoylphosphate synthase large subunit
MIIYPYKKGSKSVAALKEVFKIKAINIDENSKFKGSQNKIVLNWGNSNMNEEVNKCVVLNNPECVKIATNKDTFFEVVKGKVTIPEFTKDKDTVVSWLKDGYKVVVRETLKGHSGHGIVVISSEEEWEEYNPYKAKLYVKYVPKKEEYRIHILLGKVIDVQRKARSKNTPDQFVNWQIRNHQNGFIYAREGVEAPDIVIEEAMKAIGVTGLDFGAVDVIYNVKHKKAYVLEINTAPGLEGTSVTKYFEAIEKVIEGGAKALNKKKKYFHDLTIKQEIPIAPDMVWKASAIGGV